MDRLPVVLVVLVQVATAFDVARTPPMGFNSWTNLNSRVSASALIAVAQAMHDNGMLAAGFEYVNSDVRITELR